MTRSSLAEQAYLELRASIVDGRHSPGSILVEDEVAHLLGISRTPTRLALRRLELEGYLERDDRGRLHVHRLTAKDLIDLFFVRTLLEGYAARLAADRIADEELDELESLVGRDIAAAKRADFVALSDLNERMHRLVLRASRNRTLYQTVEELRSRVYGLSAFAVGSPRDRRQFAEDHAAILRHLRDGDAAAAEHVVTAHLAKARDLLVDGVMQARPMSTTELAASPGASAT